MTKLKKEITNKDIFGLITKLDTKISSVDTKVSSIEKNFDSKLSTMEKNLVDKIKANTDLIEEMAIITQKGFDTVDKRLLTLEQGQEDIKLSQTNHALQIDINDHEKRLKKLEFNTSNP